MTTLGPLQLELLALLGAGLPVPYIVTITDRLAERTGQTHRIGAVHTALGRLQRKGLITSTWEEAPSPRSGGRRRRLYAITDAGADALRSKPSRH